MRPTGNQRDRFPVRLCGRDARDVSAVRLAEHHLNADSKDVVGAGLGLVATMAALVLALLIVSAKSSHDTQSTEVRAGTVASWENECVDIWVSGLFSRRGGRVVKGTRLLM
jgi:hypothetical protein